MADRYGTGTGSGTGSYARNASSPTLPLESEDMSSFLHHLLHNNNPSSSSRMSSNTRHLTTTTSGLGMISSLPVTNLQSIGLFCHGEKVLPDDRRRSDHFDARFESDCRVRDWKLGGVVGSSSPGFNLADPNGYFAADVRDGGENTNNAFSRPPPGAGGVEAEAITMSEMRRSFQAENDSDSYGYDSEKGLEPAELLPNPVPPRSSSKRSRAAEIHNLSEKRRRSRINEKIKALQKLIPNSNKTDKASMLDEAIEYLKQLQLQVQMLSMRNGLSMHPVYLPGAAQPMQMMQTGTSFDENNELLNTSARSGPLTANQEPSNQTAFDLSGHCTSSNQPISAPNFSFERVNDAPYRPSFNISTASKAFSRGDTLPELQLDMSRSGKNNSASGVS